jgi:hypothetical protein
MTTRTILAALVFAAAAHAAPKPGDELDLKIRYEAERGGKPVYWLPTSRRALDDLGTYYNAKDTDGIAGMIGAGRVIEYATDKVRIRVIEFNDAGIGRVRLLAGPGKGKEVWVFNRDLD